jgi:hypothetical protein
MKLQKIANLDERNWVRILDLGPHQRVLLIVLMYKKNFLNR